MAGVRDFHNNRVDHWEVEAGGDAVIQIGRVPHHALVVVEVFFVETPADPLDSAALDLSFDVGGMNRGADGLSGRVAENFDLAGVGVDFDVNDVGGERSAPAFGINRGAADNGWLSLRPASLTTHLIRIRRRLLPAFADLF